jgi:farnesyl-diphosphate farnesyltransferase
VARSDEAKAYLLAIPRRAVSIRLFCALPLLFAYARCAISLDRRTHRSRAVVKISRSEVKSLTAFELWEC